MLKHHPRSSLGMAPKLLVAQLSSNKHYILDYKPTMSVGQTIGKKQTNKQTNKKKTGDMHNAACTHMDSCSIHKQDMHASQITMNINWTN